MAERTVGRATSPARRVAPGTSRDTPAVSPQDVGDPPQLAPGVVLSGQLEESAFEEPPALVQKDGRFIQLTDLLFQIVQKIDGKTTIDQIAGAVKKGDGTALDADEVRALIAEKLIPVGIVQTADGKVAQSKTARSPLALNMKMAVVGPETLKAVTFFFQAFFLPFIALPLLVIAFAVVAWVFLIHGVAASVHDAFYTPGLLLLTFALVVVAAAFHELGHAAGLRRGGKLPRAMGAGLYLVYPAFYTDVSENYQLKRWPRLRTDLGGFYFNLIFAVVMVVLFAVSGWEYLLFIVALVCFEIIHQLMPFVRLDGYWVLADLLGLPDFFSQIGAFVRSLVPFRIGQGGRKLPRLRWWAKVGFALYILIAVPLLTFMLFFAVKGFPRVVATAYDATTKLLAQMGEAFGKGDLILVAAIVLQLVFIALPTIGLALIIFNLAKTAVLLVWLWGRKSAGRAAIAAVGSAAAVTLLLFLWVPQLGTVAGVQSGGLASQVGGFEPIQQGETGGTVGQLVPPVNDLLRGLNLPVPSPSPSPSPTPSATPSASPTPTPVPTDTAAPFVPPPTFAPTAPPRTPTPTTPAPSKTP
jgi:putative peptide zinc metalloprotease protein